jgi:two-component system sensor histidine kinase RegB
MPSFTLSQLIETFFTRMHPLIQLRWIAVWGQILTIIFAHFILDISLPIISMAGIIGFLTAFNIFSMLHWHHREEISHTALLLSLLVDVVTFSVQIHLSGGFANPFVFLYLLQVVLAAALLKPWASWLIFVITAFFFILQIFWRSPVDIPERYLTLGLFLCFVLNAALVVAFITRINRLLQIRNLHLASLHQRAAEEEHIVRMGLLASGAAHELGTPLATISVLLNDWRRLPAFKQDTQLEEDAAEMQMQITRCKSIVSGILLSAGNMRAESPERSSLADFLNSLIAHWQTTRSINEFYYRNLITDNPLIVVDEGLKQMICNVLDNALEASPHWLSFEALTHEDDLVLRILDKGPGFSSTMLNQFGRPYQSTKGRPGSGLGLFLSLNVARSLGGNITPQNRETQGALVTITLPLTSLRIEEDNDD